MLPAAPEFLHKVPVPLEREPVFLEQPDLLNPAEVARLMQGKI